MARPWLACALVLGLVALAGPARADSVIFDSGIAATDIADGGRSHTSSAFRWAESFTLGAATEVTGVTWLGFGASAADDFTLVFYADDGGTPGSTIATLAVGTPDARSDTGEDFASLGDIFEYTTAFAGVDLDASTTYWLGITRTGSDDWFWAADSSGASSALSADGGSTWGSSNVVGDLAFALHSCPVPEPGTLALLGLGLAGLASRRRRTAR